MHAWTMLTDAPVWREIAQAKTGKDRQRAGDGGFPGFRRWLQAMMMDGALTGLCIGVHTKLSSKCPVPSRTVIDV